MQQLVTSTALLTLVAATAIWSVFLVYADHLPGWFGKGNQEGVSGLPVLLVGQVIAASAGSQPHVITMSGHERKAAWLLLTCASLNAILTVVLIQNIGLTGAAIASAGTLIAWNVTIGLFLWMRLNLKPGTVAALAGTFRKQLRPMP
jgi:O-antigen/teichoic acid export membrane protein